MIGVDKLKQKLDASKHRHIPERCRFDLGGERTGELDEILGPNALG